jgi:hypothetical protein
MGTHELLPLCHLLQGILSHSFIKSTQLSSTSQTQTPTLKPSQVLEDNSACIVLTTFESTFKPRTKHIAIK